MTAIDKRYWKWNAQDPVHSIKLGDPIDEILRKGLINKIVGQDSQYGGIDGVPWSVKEKNGYVNSIYFKETFFDFIEPDIWEFDVNEFIKKVNSLFEPVEDIVPGPRLTLVFRGGFVAIAGIEIKQKDETE